MKVKNNSLYLWKFHRVTLFLLQHNIHVWCTKSVTIYRVYTYQFILHKWINDVSIFCTRELMPRRRYRFDFFFTFIIKCILYLFCDKYLHMTGYKWVFRTGNQLATS